MAHIFILTILALLITRPGIKDYLKIRTGIIVYNVFLSIFLIKFSIARNYPYSLEWEIWHRNRAAAGRRGMMPAGFPTLIFFAIIVYNLFLSFFLINFLISRNFPYFTA